MSINVTIVGNLFQEDYKYLKNAENLKILLPGQFWNGDLENFSECAKKSDLVILSLFGTDLPLFLIDQQHNPRLKEFFANRFTKKVVWTFDCHHQTLSERKCQILFDRFYLAHSPYMPAYNPERTAWLPTCYCHFPIDSLVENSKLKPKIERDILLPCKPYPIGDRDYIIAKIARILEKRGLACHIGPLGSNGSNVEYMHALLRSRICVNVSLSDDLNIRNFDTWACNRILLSNHVPDHDLVDVDKSHTYFYKRDLTDFESMLDKALSDPGIGINTANPVLRSHTLIHRYVEMINRELGTNIIVDVPMAH